MSRWRRLPAVPAAISIAAGAAAHPCPRVVLTGPAHRTIAPHPPGPATIRTARTDRDPQRLVGSPRRLDSIHHHIGRIDNMWLARAAVVERIGGCGLIQDDQQAGRRSLAGHRRIHYRRRLATRVDPANGGIIDRYADEAQPGGREARLPEIAGALPDPDEQLHADNRDRRQESHERRHRGLLPQGTHRKVAGPEEGRPKLCRRVSTRCWPGCGCPFRVIQRSGW